MAGLVRRRIATTRFPSATGLSIAARGPDHSDTRGLKSLHRLGASTSVAPGPYGPPKVDRSSGYTQRDDPVSTSTVAEFLVSNLVVCDSPARKEPNRGRASG